MRELTPDYYHKFHCKADLCKHSCCIGWEIDIDELTMEKYNALKAPLGEKIRANIEGDPPHFILKDNDRCPFLLKNGLCEIICRCGEDVLCDICALHPRFVNYYEDFCEVGLGLSCEECARIILTEEEKFNIVLPEIEALDEDERRLFLGRAEILSILQNREKPVSRRFSELQKAFNIDFKFELKSLLPFYLSLERLDEKWTKELELLKGSSFDGDILEADEMQIPFEQLACYFIFRHMPKGLDSGDYGSVVKFAIVSCYMIAAVLERKLKEEGILSTEEMIDAVRIYSSEIEYSEENTDALLML